MNPRKLYIDSRKRASGSHSDFDYQLPNPIQVPRCRCFVDAVHLANVFPTITEHSRFIYIEEITAGNVATKRKVGLTAGIGHDGTTLASEVETQLNNGTTLPASYSCVFTSSTGRLTISNTSPLPADFSVWPADYLKHGLWNPLNSGSIPDYIAGDDCYDIIGFAGVSKITGNSTTPIAGGHITVTPYHTLFLHSDLGLQGDSIGPDNSQSIIRKIVVETAPGTLINDFHSLPYDYVSVQATQVRNIHFRLADYRGRTVDLLHTGMSFSLLFVPEDEF
jgi:hypothetical protein